MRERPGPGLLPDGLDRSGSLKRDFLNQMRSLRGALLRSLPDLLRPGPGVLRLGGGWCRAGPTAQPVVHLDDGGVVDQVQALEVDTAYLGAEQVLEFEDELVLVADGPIDYDGLVAVVAHERGVVADPQGGEDEDHENGDDDEVALDPAEQAEGQSREEVGHLALGQGGGAQADDGQDAEEPQAQAGSDVVAR